MQRSGKHDGAADPCPLESGADGGHQVVAGAAVGLGDTPGQAVDPPFKALVRIAHEGNKARSPSRVSSRTKPALLPS